MNIPDPLDSPDSKAHAAESLCDYDFTLHGGLPILTEALRAGSNKVMAVLGDRVMGLVIAEDGFDKGLSKGSIDVSFQRQLRNNRLAEVCRESGLEHCILVHPGQQGSVSDRTAADTIEAVVGAAFKTGNMLAARKVMNNLGIIEGGNLW